jgi:hypothetical protein
MRIPQLSDRIKEAPTQALRAVFAGIGQMLLAADRIRKRDSQQRPGSTTSAPVTAAKPAAATPAAATPAAAEPQPAKPAAATPAAAEPQPAKPAAATPAAATPAAATPAAATPAAATPAAATPAAATPVPAKPEHAEPLAALPISNYDDLSLASLRGRLRNLDPDQLRVLIDYEQAHAGREAVVTMFERRIAKLGSTGD